MLEITEATTVPMLREYAEQNNIDLGNAKKRQEIIDIIQAVVTSPEDKLKTDEAKRGDDQQGNTTEVVVIDRLLQASRLLMKGADVSAVQNALEGRGIKTGMDKSEGIYGAKTAYAVRMFQARNRLIVDGKVGKFTAMALGFEWQG